MNSSELLDLFRDEAEDQAEPYLWPDERVFSYIEDAQTMFCRKTDGISDATTPAVTTVAIAVDTDWVDLHPSILKIRSVTRTDTGREIEVLNHEDLPGRGWRFDGRTGPVKALVIGIEENKARVFPTSSEVVDLNLVVFRLPLVPITDAGDQEFEIPERHHRHLLKWVKHLAYSKQDAETFDKKKALDFKMEFLSYCEEVMVENRRKRHKNRAVVYGGI